jgi:hypothetical protein
MGPTVAVRPLTALVGVAALGVLLASPSVCRACAGDCDCSGTVTVAELVKGVDIALGQESLSACPALDGDGSGKVSIAELIAAVDAALLGCQPVEPTDLLLSSRIAVDGTLYYILSARGSPGACGGEAIRLTSLAASTTGTQVCAAVGNTAGDPTSALAGVLPPGQVLHPYDDTLRTRVLHPGSDLVRFSAAGSGQVILGPGAEAISVCAADADCAAAPGGVAPLYPLDATPGEPPACIATASPDCTVAEAFDFLAFGVASAGSPPVCRSSESDVTIDTTICGPLPRDGFTLRPGDAIVFTFGRGETLRGFSFSIAAAGFTSAPDEASQICAPNQVLRPVAVIDNVIVPP